jgi:hypothetical protein
MTDINSRVSTSCVATGSHDASHAHSESCPWSVDPVSAIPVVVYDELETSGVALRLAQIPMARSSSSSSSRRLIAV